MPREPKKVLTNAVLKASSRESPFKNLLHVNKLKNDKQVKTKINTQSNSDNIITFQLKINNHPKLNIKIAKFTFQTVKINN
jgi:hypothetical protein